MKSLFMALLVIGFFGCTSKPKSTTSSSNTATTTTTTAANTPKTEPAKTETVKEKAPAPKVAVEKKSEVGTATLTCKSGADERTLVINVKDAGCELVYTKMGEAKTIATQIKGSEKCEEVMSQVKENLTKAAFTCQ